MRLRGTDVMTAPAPSGAPLLEMKNVAKEYRGVAALKNIDFDLRRGEVHAILGENGAGKSTLVKILSGAVSPTGGEIRLDGQRIQIAGPAEARRYGIAMVYQETSLVPSLTVAQNLYLGDEKFFNRLRGAYIEAQQFLQSLNFPVDPTATVLSLGTAKRQMVEIARAVRLRAKVIIFDEPTATLTPEERGVFWKSSGRFWGVKAKKGPVDIGFWRLGPARKFGIMGDGEIGQGTASAVGWIFVLGLSGARDRSWRIW